MEAQTFMLIECPRCFAMMRCRAKFCRRCGRELSTATPLATADGIPKIAAGEPKARRPKILCWLGGLLLLSACTHNSIDRFALGIVMFALPREKHRAEAQGSAEFDSALSRVGRCPLEEGGRRSS